MRRGGFVIGVCAAILLFISPAMALSCGKWLKTAKAVQFADEKIGTIARQSGSNYFVLKRSACVDYRDFDDLYFVLNHNGAEVEQPSFVAIHVALVKISDKQLSRQYLYRNSGQWRQDTSGLSFGKTYKTPHAEFNRQLAGDPEAFDRQYSADSRVWHDRVETKTNPPVRFDTRGHSPTFQLRQDLLSAIEKGNVSILTQNYLLSFVTRRASKDLGNPPGFSVDATGYDCAVIRVSGTSAFPEFDGEYMLSRTRSDGCQDLLSSFSGNSGNSLWSFLRF